VILVCLAWTRPGLGIGHYEGQCQSAGILKSIVKPLRGWQRTLDEAWSVNLLRYLKGGTKPFETGGVTLLTIARWWWAVQQSLLR